MFAIWSRWEGMNSAERLEEAKGSGEGFKISEPFFALQLREGRPTLFCLFAFVSFSVTSVSRLKASDDLVTILGTLGLVNQASMVDLSADFCPSV